MSQATEDQASKKTVMLCEDEYIVALDIQLLLEDMDFEVLGPFADMTSARDALDGTKPDFAVLDVNLRDGHVFPLADTLSEAGVRLIFHSGHADDTEINRRYPDAVTCMKPIDPARLKDVLVVSEA